MILIMKRCKLKTKKCSYISVLVLLVDCEAVSDEDYLNYNYEYLDDGNVNVKTTSLAIFSPSDLIFF